MAFIKNLLILITSLLVPIQVYAGNGFDINNPLEGLPPLESLQGTNSASGSTGKDASMSGFDLNDPLEGLPLFGNKQQQCAQLAHRINSLRERALYYERQADLAEKDMQNISHNRASFNTGLAIGRARSAAEYSYKYGIYADRKIHQLIKQYNELCCDQ